ncbi:hypothetical protein ATSB10_32650 [Dyella thiooxydans]|uniref:Uncharacterized protein n=1 Tax=Dyella thiooxydans TaxID=445710 RepID=A0A161JJJ6_9GAMM|nr:hypothetical protein ATSB10_32650 [Dyella thiooxydans]
MSAVERSGPPRAPPPENVTSALQAPCHRPDSRRIHRRFMCLRPDHDHRQGAVAPAGVLIPQHPLLQIWLIAGTRAEQAGEAAACLPQVCVRGSCGGDPILQRQRTSAAIRRAAAARARNRPAVGAGAGDGPA